MRKIFFVLLLLTVCISSCKKEKIEAEKKLLPEDNIPNAPTCTGNTWVTGNNFYGHADDWTFNIPASLVYNNKVYMFDVASGLVRIYNGANWQQLPSAVPFANSYNRINFGFTIGSKGYIGDLDNDIIHPFWEYDFIANTWEQKTNFPGYRRAECSAATFAIGTKGYVVGGLSEQNGNAITLQETWEYDPANDAWAQKADVPLDRRTSYASGFSANNKGYILAGRYSTETSSTNLKKLTEYDPLSDTWSNKANFPGPARYHPSVFVIGGVVYAGCGRTLNTFFKDFYNYIPGADSWMQVADVPVTNPSIFGFAINQNGYVEFIDQTRNPNFLLKYTPRKCIYPNSPQ